jgi:exopolysaccharide biosynthesis polyprenyl glycosylphosphotransferase
VTDFAVGGIPDESDDGGRVREIERRRPAWVVPDAVPAIVPRAVRHTEPRWVRMYRRAAIAADLMGATLGVFVALLYSSHVGARYLVLGCILQLAWVFGVWYGKGYDARFYGAGAEEFRAILRSGVGITAAVAIAAYATKTGLARSFVLLAIPMTIALALVLRWLLRLHLHRNRDAGRCMRRVLVVGRSRQAGELTGYLGQRRVDGFRVVATCVPRGEGGRRSSPHGELTEADILAAVDEKRVDMVAVAADNELAGQSLRRLSWALEQRGVDLIVSPGIVEVAGPRISVRPVAGLSLLHLDRPSVSAGPHLMKSAFDRCGALFLIVVFAPLLLAVAVAIKLTSSGPVLFRQERVGRGGARFSMLKFRSMCVDAEDQKSELMALDEGNGVLFKIRNDPRVTPLGRLLRRFSLDELPQLFNVLRGDMSLVGPRPPLPSEVEMYAADDTRRMLVKPGLTGLWQVSGRSELTWEETVQLDLRYVDNWSIALDLLILWKTARAVLGRDGAY